jgi:hypothetical protein
MFALGACDDPGPISPHFSDEQPFDPKRVLHEGVRRRIPGRTT